MTVLLWLVIAMIIYDFSIHLIFLLGKQDYFLNRKLNYWPEWSGANSKLRYQQFWTAYWGFAALLLIAYTFTK